DAVQQGSCQLDRRQLAGADGGRGLRRRQPMQIAHSPVPAFIGGQGSARGSAGAFSFATQPLACAAAAATSSGNSCSALSSPACRASNSIVALSIIPASRVDLTQSRSKFAGAIGFVEPLGILFRRLFPG